MICLPNKKRALAVSSIRDRVRNRIGAPFTIITSPWRSSRTRLDIISLPRSMHFSRNAGGPGAGPAGTERRLLEQAEQCLRCLVRQRQRLRAQLLADLQCSELGRFLGQISVYQRPKPTIQ